MGHTDVQTLSLTDMQDGGKTGVTGVETGEEPSTSSPQAEAATGSMPDSPQPPTTVREPALSSPKAEAPAGSMPVSPPPPTTAEASGKHLVRDEVSYGVTNVRAGHWHTCCCTQVLSQ